MWAASGAGRHAARPLDSVVVPEGPGGTAPPAWPACDLGRGGLTVGGRLGAGGAIVLPSAGGFLVALRGLGVAGRSGTTRAPAQEVWQVGWLDT